MWVFVQDPSFEESFSAAYRQQVASAAGVPVTAVAITGIQASSVLVQTQVDLAVLTFRCSSNILAVFKGTQALPVFWRASVYELHEVQLLYLEHRRLLIVKHC